MTRSFGDTVAASVGVTSDPEIFDYDLMTEDKIIVLASDGVWDLFTNSEVAKIIFPFYLKMNAEGAAE